MNFKALVKSKGLTIKALSALSGISPRTIDEYMQGRRNIANAQLHIGVALAESLEIHPKELIDEPSE